VRESGSHAASVYSRRSRPRRSRRPTLSGRDSPISWLVGCLRVGRSEVEGPVRPMPVGVVDEDSEHPVEIPSAEDQKPVAPFGASRPDEAPGDGIGLGRANTGASAVGGGESVRTSRLSRFRAFVGTPPNERGPAMPPTAAHARAYAAQTSARLGKAGQPTQHRRPSPPCRRQYGSPADADASRPTQPTMTSQPAQRQASTPRPPRLLSRKATVHRTQNGHIRNDTRDASRRISSLLTSPI
jgi:hypothetical protein